MEISVSHRLYNSFGGHRSISIVADVLEYDIPEFGEAIKELEITIHFFHDGPAKKSLEKMQKEFHKSLEALPKSTFYRKKQRLCIEFEGKFTTGYEIQKSRKPPIQINPEWAKSTLEEIIDHFSLMKSKLKKSDHFDFTSFEEYSRSKLNDFPETLEALENIQNIVSARKKEAYNKLDEWEKLGIDWSEYHPKAKNIVPSAYLWSCTDEFSPNGNDTGADTLELFRKWDKGNKNKPTTTFLERLLKDWEIDINHPYESEYSSYTYLQTVVGLAFSSAKLRGECEKALKERAILAIDEYLKSIESKTDWEYLGECQIKLTQSKSVIEKMPNKSN